MGFNDYPANQREERGVVHWASREVDNPQMYLKQWGFCLGEDRLARYLSQLEVRFIVFNFYYKAW